MRRYGGRWLCGRQGKAHKCVFVRVRPQIEESEKNRNLFKNLGLRPAPMYLSVEYAGVLDITKPEEELEVGKSVNAKIIDMDLEHQKLELSIRELEGTSREYKEE